MKSFHEMTNYSKIYSGVYWGSFKFDPDRNKDMNPIFENRNKFAENYKLKKTLNKDDSNIKLLLNYEFNYDNISKYIENYPSPAGVILIQCENLLITNNYYDHVEVYETNDNKIIILSSPYIKKNDNYKTFLESRVFIDLDELLYSNDAVSFYKIYDKMELKQIKQKYKDLIKQKKGTS